MGSNYSYVNECFGESITCDVVTETHTHACSSSQGPASFYVFRVVACAFCVYLELSSGYTQFFSIQGFLSPLPGEQEGEKGTINKQLCTTAFKEMSKISLPKWEINSTKIKGRQIFLSNFFTN